jgi:hypothetical protein
VKLVGVIVAPSIADRNVALTIAVVAIPVAPAVGSVESTVGVPAVAVVKVHVYAEPSVVPPAAAAIEGASVAV